MNTSARSWWMLSVRNLLMSSKFCTGSTIPGSGCAFSKPWQNSNSKITHQENEKLDPDQTLKTCIYCFCTVKTKRLLPTFIVAAAKTFSVLFNLTNFLLLIDYCCWTKTISALIYLWIFKLLLVFNTFNWLGTAMLGALDLFKEAVGMGQGTGHQMESMTSKWEHKTCIKFLKFCRRGEHTYITICIARELYGRIIGMLLTYWWQDDWWLTTNWTLDLRREQRWGASNTCAYLGKLTFYLTGSISQALR